MKRYKEVKKKWGKEIWVINNELYCYKILICDQNIWSSEGKFHYHKIKDETFVVTLGTLILEVIKNDSIDKILMKQNDSYRIKPLTLHRFKAFSPVCKFIEISTTHFDEDSYRLSFDEYLNSGRLKNESILQRL
jgi:mannose-6-phosphate isomerase-like protein (cupin superfamily)